MPLCLIKISGLFLNIYLFQYVDTLILRILIPKTSSDKRLHVVVNPILI